jgi:hypothetical protein
LGFFGAWGRISSSIRHRRQHCFGGNPSDEMGIGALGILFSLFWTGASFWTGAHSSCGVMRLPAPRDERIEHHASRITHRGIPYRVPQDYISTA